jgi:hypothetical protein
MKQEAVVTVFGLSFSSYCEKLITETYENNSTKVRDSISLCLKIKIGC